MGYFDLTIHLLSFAAPAVGVAFLLASAGRWVGGPEARRHPWWVAFLADFLVGLAVLFAGLWLFGRDGKMATYALLVLAAATAQWFVGRGWRA